MRDDCAGNGHTLLLAAGEFRGRMVFPLEQPHTIQGLSCRLMALFGGDPAVKQRQFHVFQRRGARKEIKPLKHKPHAAAPQKSALIFGERFHMHAFKEVLPGGGAVEGPDDIHRGGLT